MSDKFLFDPEGEEGSHFDLIPAGSYVAEIIDAKIAGEEVVAPEVAEPPKVVDLMEALRKSLDAVSTEKKKPAKAANAAAAAASKPTSIPKAAVARKRKAG